SDDREIIRRPENVRRQPGEVGRVGGGDDRGRAALLSTFRNSNAPIRALTVSPDATLAAVGGDDRAGHILETAPGRVRMVLKGHTGRIVAIAFFPDGKTLVTVGNDGIVKLWDLASGKELASLKVAAQVQEGALSPQAKRLVTADDQTIRLWDLA